MEEPDYKYKITILGDEAVGKTCLIKKYVYDKFDDVYLLTLGTKTTKKSVLLKAKGREHEIEVKLVIWDIMGQREFSRAFSSFFAGTHAGILVCDMTRKKTLRSLQNWIDDLFAITGPIPLVFVGNKCDLVDSRAVSEEELKAMADKYKAPYFLSSAKTGENVERFFYGISKMLLERRAKIQGITDFAELPKKEVEGIIKRRKHRIQEAQELERKFRFGEAKKIYDELEMEDFSKKAEFMAQDHNTQLDFVFDEKLNAMAEKGKTEQCQPKEEAAQPDVGASKKDDAEARPGTLTNAQRLQLLEDRFLLGQIDKETYERLRKKYG